jgi:hypothetical protein
MGDDDDFSLRIIERVVSRALEYTDHILERAPQHRSAVIRELRRTRETLAVGVGASAILTRLDAYISKLERRQLN